LICLINGLVPSVRALVIPVEEHLDGRPPGLDRLGERGQLRDVVVGAPPVEAVADLGGVAAVGGAVAHSARSSSFAIQAARIAPGLVVVDAAAPHPRQSPPGEPLASAQQ